MLKHGHLETGSGEVDRRDETIGAGPDHDHPSVSAHRVAAREHGHETGYPVARDRKRRQKEKDTEELRARIETNEL
jgi:hypothetical protein